MASKEKRVALYINSPYKSFLKFVNENKALDKKNHIMWDD